MGRLVSVVITDLDNTLYDWVDMWYRSFSSMLGRLVVDTGIPASELEPEFRAIHQKYGTSEYAFSIEELPSLKGKYPGEDLSKRFDAAIHEFNKARKAALSLYPSVLETLETLRDKGCLLVAYTESMAYYTNYRLRNLGLDLLLDFVYSPPDHDLPSGCSIEEIRRYPAEHYRLRRTIPRYLPKGHVKPDPTVLLDIIRDTGASLEETIYVGDSLMKDVTMAQLASVTDVWAKYGTAQHRNEYELLRRVSHWPDVAVQKEKIITDADVKSTYTLLESFSELLKEFDFVSYEDRSSKTLDVALDAWKKTVDVQQHFNDIEMTIRNYAVTTLVAALGATAFAFKDNLRILWHGHNVSLVLPLLAAASIGWLAFYFMDRAWYHRLLVGAVKHGQFIESKWKRALPELSLTEAIGKESPIPFKLFKWKGRIRSAHKIDAFYLVIFVLLCAMIVAVYLLGPSPGPPPAARPSGSVNGEPGGSHPETEIEARSAGGLVFWPFIISGLGLVCGTTMLVLGSKNKSMWVQSAGIGTIAASLLTHFSLVDKINFGDLFKLEKPSFSVNLTAELEKLGGFGPRHLTALDNFPLGEATMDDGTRSRITSKVCDEWREGLKVGRDGVILVIGSTDRVPLSPASRGRYESNVGLARARAEWVTEGIIRCGVPEEKLISLVTGPQHTPDKQQQRERSTEFGGDRRVDVWVFWSLPEDNKDKKGAQRK